MEAERWKVDEPLQSRSLIQWYCGTCTFYPFEEIGYVDWVDGFKQDLEQCDESLFDDVGDNEVGDEVP